MLGINWVGVYTISRSVACKSFVQVIQKC